MLRFTEMTDAELLALTETELEELIDLECAYEGIPLLPPKPEEPIKPANLRPDTSVFHFDDIYITDPEEARRAEELLRSFTSIVKLEWFSLVQAMHATLVHPPSRSSRRWKSTPRSLSRPPKPIWNASMRRPRPSTRQNKLYREISNRREDLNDGSPAPL